MERIPKDPDREYRIYNEAIVDTYGEEEQAMGWYYYINDKLYCPFQAKCIQERIISPLREGKKVKVQGMAPEDECIKEVFVKISWKGRVFAVPLSQLEAVGEAEDETLEAIEDWHYWIARGYQF